MTSQSTKNSTFTSTWLLGKHCISLLHSLKVSCCHYVRYALLVVNTVIFTILTELSSLFCFQSGSCTLQEAVIIGGILHKASIPMLHSAAALLKLAEMNYNGACSVFLRTLLDKKYALPYRVVDAVVFHFLG